MSARARTRTLAALCALLMLLGTVPVSAFVEKPIDRPEGPPTPKPTEVGDPDQPSGNIVLIVHRWVFVIRVPFGGIGRESAVRSAPRAMPRANPRVRNAR